MEIFLLIGGLCALASGLAGLYVLILAFMNSVADGFLSLCVPFYIIYFAFAKLEHEKKNTIIAVWIGGGILYSIFFAMGAASL